MLALKSKCCSWDIEQISMFFSFHIKIINNSLLSSPWNAICDDIVDLRKKDTKEVKQLFFLKKKEINSIFLPVLREVIFACLPPPHLNERHDEGEQ